MNVLLFITLAVVMTVAIYVLSHLLYLLFRWFLSELAKRSIPPVTFRTDGQIKAIMSGEACDWYLMKVENHIIDPFDFDIFEGYVDEDGEDHNLEKYKNYLAEIARKKSTEFLAPGILNPEYDPMFRDRKLQRIPDSRNPGQFTVEFSDTFKTELIKANRPKWFEKTFHVTWIGWPPLNVFAYTFRWIKYGQKEAPPGGAPSAEVVMTPRDEVVNSIYFRFSQYGATIEAKTGAGSLQAMATGNIPEQIDVIFQLVMETQTRNPQKSLFRTAGRSSAGEWLNAIWNIVRDVTRAWTTEQTWDTIIKEQDAVRKFLEKLRHDVNNGIRLPDDTATNGRIVSSIKDYGQEILKINLVHADLKSQPLRDSINEIFQAKRLVLKAQQVKLATFEEAAGDQALAAADGLGRAQGYKAIIDAGGEKVAIAEAFGKGGIKVLGGTGTLINLPSNLVEDTTPPPKNKGGKP